MVDKKWFLMIFSSSKFFSKRTHQIKKKSSHNEIAFLATIQSTKRQRWNFTQCWAVNSEIRILSTVKQSWTLVRICRVTIAQFLPIALLCRNIAINSDWLPVFYLPLYNPSTAIMTISFQIFSQAELHELASAGSIKQKQIQWLKECKVCR